MAALVLSQEDFLPVEPRADRRWERVRLGLLAGWLLLLAGVWVWGEHAVPVSRLDAAVVTGDVSTVRVSPPVLGSHSTGVQSAHWRAGIHRYVVSVRVVNGGRRPAGGPSYPVVRRPLGDRLRAEAPSGVSLRVLPTSQTLPTAELLGRWVPGWVNAARLGLYLAGLVVLGYGPEPWRARRWAWFWLMSLFGLQTLGALAFLALSGPTPLLAPPRPDRRRLGSGWAFVIALLFAGLGGS